MKSMWEAHDYLFDLAQKACKEQRPYEVQYLMTQAAAMQRIAKRIDNMKLDNDGLVRHNELTRL